jgi:glycosyltransferase involved in cell wall biosynthesis
VIYEVHKLLRVAQLRFSDRRAHRSTILVSRVSPVGIASIIAPALGVSVYVEVNGLPDLEFADRGYGPWVQRAVRSLTNTQLRRSSGAVAVTTGLAAESARRGAPRTLRLENGAATTLANVGPGDPYTVCYSGAFAPWQDLETVVRAIAVLAERHPSKPWRLLLIGDGPLRTAVQRTATACGVAELMTITGWLSQPAAHQRLGEALVAVSPHLPRGGSDTCGSPLKLYEYLAAGRRVVAADVDGVRDVEGLDVVLYSPRNPESLAAAIELAAARGPVGREELERVRRAISWDDRAQRLLEWLGCAPAPPDASAAPEPSVPVQALALAKSAGRDAA